MLLLLRVEGPRPDLDAWVEITEALLGLPEHAGVEFRRVTEQGAADTIPDALTAGRSVALLCRTPQLGGDPGALARFAADPSCERALRVLLTSLPDTPDTPGADMVLHGLPLHPDLEQITHAAAAKAGD